MDTGELYIEMCQKAFPSDAEQGNALRTQDQLQEMLGGWGAAKLAEVFGEWAKNYRITQETYPSSASMEQLWLAFVMKEKYNKVWNGENWVDTTKHLARPMFNPLYGEAYNE